MEINELKEEMALLRKVLRGDIQSRIRNFTDKTGVNVNSVSVRIIDTRTIDSSAYDTVVDDVNVEITL